MATISKKTVKRINELLQEARQCNDAADECVLLPIYAYWALREGLAVRALFDEFRIEAEGVDWFTEDRIEGLRIQVEAAGV